MMGTTESQYTTITTPVSVESSSESMMTYDQLAALMVSLSQTTWQMQLWPFASVLVMGLWILVITLMRATQRNNHEVNSENGGNSAGQNGGNKNSGSVAVVRFCCENFLWFCCEIFLSVSRKTGLKNWFLFQFRANKEQAGLLQLIYAYLSSKNIVLRTLNWS